MTWTFCLILYRKKMYRRWIKDLNIKIKLEKFWIYGYIFFKTLRWEGHLPLSPKPRISVCLKILHKNEKVLYDQKNINQIKRHRQIGKKLCNSHDK